MSGVKAARLSLTLDSGRPKYNLGECRLLALKDADYTLKVGFRDVHGNQGAFGEINLETSGQSEVVEGLLQSPDVSYFSSDKH